MYATPALGPDFKDVKLSGDKSRVPSASEESCLKGEDVLGLQDLDPAMNRKMHLVNNVRHPLKPLSGPHY